MLKIRNLNFIVSSSCNLSCKYCGRSFDRNKNLEFTPAMIGYLKQLSPSWCKTVIASGGEPLLYWNKVKELFSYIPAGIHKIIMSNCTLLNQEIVDYIKANDVTLYISHDGPMTKFLRGVDILENKKTVDLLCQIDSIHCFGVITKYNVDVWENFFDTAQKLGRSNFEYECFPFSDKPSQSDLFEGFDYETWVDTYIQFLVSPFRRYRFSWRDNPVSTKETKKISGIIYPGGFMFLPDGTACGCTSPDADYGSLIHSCCYEDLCWNLIKSGKLNFCLDSNCAYKNLCNNNTQCATEHICKCRRMMWERLTSSNIKIVKQYVREHLEDIQNKYEYMKS